MRKPSKTTGNFRIELGSVQVPVFERVFDALFEEAVALSTMEAGDGVEAIIVPVFEELQFAIPAQTRSQFFEVWIKYRIDVYDPGGELLAQWPLPAYGKSNERKLRIHGGLQGVRVDRSLGAGTPRRRRTPVVLLSARAGDRGPGRGGMRMRDLYLRVGPWRAACARAPLLKALLIGAIGLSTMLLSGCVTATVQQVREAHTGNR